MIRSDEEIMRRGRRALGMSSEPSMTTKKDDPHKEARAAKEYICGVVQEAQHVLSNEFRDESKMFSRGDTLRNLILIPILDAIKEKGGEVKYAGVRSGKSESDSRIKVILSPSPALGGETSFTISNSHATSPSGRAYHRFQYTKREVMQTLEELGLRVTDCNEKDDLPDPYARSRRKNRGLDRKERRYGLYSPSYF